MHIYRYILKKLNTKNKEVLLPRCFSGIRPAPATLTISFLEYYIKY